MFRKYERQEDIKQLIGRGDLIYYRKAGEKHRNPASGEVEYIDRNTRRVLVKNINEMGQEAELSLDDITLYYDTAWRK